ncbi:MAG: hypothetical protein HY841_03240 [Bacteroidetes bacterium]|nr:hypothetical protein [Bacteroidota bacterium]
MTNDSPSLNRVVDRGEVLGMGIEPKTPFYIVVSIGKNIYATVRIVQAKATDG